MSQRTHGGHKRSSNDGLSKFEKPIPKTHSHSGRPDGRDQTTLKGTAHLPKIK